MDSFNNVLYLLDAESGILTLTVNRPDKLNALNAATIEEIRAAVQHALDGVARAAAAHHLPGRRHDVTGILNPVRLLHLRWRHHISAVDDNGRGASHLGVQGGGSRSPQRVSSR